METNLVNLQLRESVLSKECNNSPNEGPKCLKCDGIHPGSLQYCPNIDIQNENGKYCCSYLNFDGEKSANREDLIDRSGDSASTLFRTNVHLNTEIDHLRQIITEKDALIKCLQTNVEFLQQQICSQNSIILSLSNTRQSVQETSKFGGLGSNDAVTPLAEVSGARHGQLQTVLHPLGDSSHLQSLDLNLIDNYLGKKYKLATSENLDEYLRELGVGLVTRKVANAVSPVVELNKYGDEYVLTSNSTFKNIVTKFKPDVEFDQETPDGSRVKATISIKDWTLKEVQKIAEGREATIERTWTKDKMIMVMSIGDITATRIYLLQP